MKFNKNILFTLLTSFALAWVIWGDLVAMHINVIYDVDIHSLQPYAKTHKSDEKIIKSKDGKTTAFNFFHDIFLCEKETFQFEPGNYIVTAYTEYTDVLYNLYIHSLKGRSPPV
jgi:hypothetical protein